MIATDPTAAAEPRPRLPSTACPPAGIPTAAMRLAAIGLFLTAAALLAPPPATVSAQGWIDPLPRMTDWGVVKLRTDVTVRVDGRVAHVEVEEWFENRGRGLGEGDYLYPLPGEAVFSDFSLYQGDHELRGETMDADRARAIYEEIVRSRRDPALIELVGNGLVRARVFPFEPGERRRITLRYTQVLDRAGDAVQFRYLAGRANRGVVARPRPGGDRPLEPTGRGVSDAVRDGVPVRFTLTADAESYGRPFSPTHTLDVDRHAGELRVRPAGDLHGGFSVFLPLLRPVVGLSLATHRPSREPGYFMLTLSPGEVRAAATPRDVTAVVDVSGSMAGEKMEQTRRALHQLLASLGPRDRFRLVSFSTGVASNTDAWSGTTRAELAAARDWVDGLRARGGTNIAGALEEAFHLTTPDDRLPIVVFLTDGLPTVGERDPERIAAMAASLGGRARVFAFGVGYDVNTYLLDRLTAAGRGTTAYVEPGQDVEMAVGGLAARITHPVLTDLVIQAAPGRITEVYPLTLPDLFAGEELVVFGRYEQPGAGGLRVQGQRAGRPETFALAADFPARATANEFIPRLWAARKLGELTRQVRLHGPDPELIEEIRSTALRYGLLSDYTAHLVQEPTPLARTRRGGDGRALGVTPAAGAPAPVTGAAAVRAAESARLHREVASSMDLATAEAAVERAAVGSGRRMVGGRWFEHRDDGWVQALDTDGVREVRVRLYSPAFFALLEAIPELRSIVAELERVRVAGKQVAFRFGDEGQDRLSSAEVARLAAEFRGR
jgi:Ca-activated chloride channel homolog